MVCPAVAQGHSALLSVPLQSKEIVSSLSCINIRFLHFLQPLETGVTLEKNCSWGSVLPEEAQVIAIPSISAAFKPQFISWS